MYVRVNVKAGMKKEYFTEISAGHFEVAIKEKAERNMANTRIIELIARHFEVPEGKVRIVNGHRHPHKLIAVDNEE